MPTLFEYRDGPHRLRGEVIVMLPVGLIDGSYHHALASALASCSTPIDPWLATFFGRSSPGCASMSTGRPGLLWHAARHYKDAGLRFHVCVQLQAAFAASGRSSARSNMNVRGHLPCAMVDQHSEPVMAHLPARPKLDLLRYGSRTLRQLPHPELGSGRCVERHIRSTLEEWQDVQSH